MRIVARRTGRIRGFGWAALAALLAAGLAACAGASTPGGAPKAHGVVRVLYAGSLTNLMEQVIGPGFTRSTGYAYQGFAAGSKELASEIRARIRTGDVFISASPAVDRSLEGSGGWVRWYARFASVPLVIGYNPRSKFAGALRRQPWYRVLAEPGFRLGRTDPALDPKGALTVSALDAAALAYHQPGLVRAVLANSEVFPEEELLGRLEAGQLDAGFFYRDEALAQHLPIRTLGAVVETAPFTVTVLARAPDPASAAAFVSYLLGKAGTAAFRAAGFDVSAPVLSGARGALPASLRARLRPGG